MPIEFNDSQNKVIVNPRDVNKVIVEEQVVKVDISTGGPQGIPGPVGPIGPAGASGKYVISETPPTGNIEQGDLWFKSSTAQFYTYFDGFWIETSTSYLGPATTLNVGTVTTGAPGSQASVEVTGVPPSQTINFTIPRGDTGIAGQSASEPTATRWSPTFQATGLTFTGSNSTYPTYNSYYVKFGQLVSFNIKIDLNTVTNFGTGQLKVELPFIPIPSAANHFSAWSWVNPSQPADDLNGHIQMVADHLPNSQTLDLHWLLATTSNPKPIIESLYSQGIPVTLTTASKIYVNGTYISAN